jgi:hypothetical protein
VSTKVHKIRPPKGVSFKELFRYADGEWITDDGQKDLAFYGMTTKGVPYAYYKQLSPLAHSDHPNELAGRNAMDTCCRRYHCANGRPVK